MLNRLQNEWRSHIIFGLALMMLISLYLPRVFLSASMACFTIACLADSSFLFYLRRFFTSPLLWGMSILFLVPMITGLWSEDSSKWLEMVRIKLPLLVLPLAFAGAVSLSNQHWNWLAIGFILLVTGGTIWSMMHYAQDITSVNESYLKAKTLLTPLKNDRIRFSWMVFTGALAAGWLAFKEKSINKQKAIFFSVVTLWLVIYLHILAVRTGLLSFYLALLIAAIVLLAKRNKYSWLLLLAMLSVPVIAYFTIPTFHNRVKYVLYDKGFFEKANYQPGASDAVRIISLKAGWQIMKNHPLRGVGFGDVPAEANKWYIINYPAMLEADKIYPASEWLMYGAGFGIPGLILFTLSMLLPFFIKVKYRLPWWMLNAAAAFSFLFDIGLEVQFGVFIYAFTVLWWWKWLKEEKL